jgi:hypothetical protein
MTDQAERCELCDRVKTIHPNQDGCWAHRAAHLYNEAVRTRQFPVRVDVEFKHYCQATDNCLAHRVDWRSRAQAAEKEARELRADDARRDLSLKAAIQYGKELRDDIERLKAALAEKPKGGPEEPPLQSPTSSESTPLPVR